LLEIRLISRIGPFDGSDGHVYRYDVTTSVWTDISPVPGECSIRPAQGIAEPFTAGTDRYFGFGGLAVDLRKPGTIMVAALNSWQPDGQIWRSTNSGTTWSPLWAWADRPNRDKYYSWDTSLAPWLSSFTQSQVGWMMEALVIDPFDSDHNITLKSLAGGIEETAVLALISPPSGPILFSGVGDVGGFAHADLDKAPSSAYANPTFGNTVSLDYAGNKPNIIVRPHYALAILTLINVQVRIGNSDSDATTRKIALSYDSGASWAQYYGAALGVSGGAVAISAEADTILWRDVETNTVKYSRSTSAFTASIGVPPGAAIASDKKVRSLH